MDDSFMEEFSVILPGMSSHSFNEDFIFPFKRKTREELAGYPPDRFQTQPPPEFLCFMCSNVAKKPLECKKCGKLCCDVCLQTCIITSDKQPNRNFKCKVCDFIQEPRKPSQLLLRMISEMKIKCKNFDMGCETYVCLDESAKHEQVCPFTEVKCKNYENCKKVGLIKDFEEVEGSTRSIYSHMSRYGPRGKLFVCSQHCKRLANFEKMVADRQKDKALMEYYNVIKGE